MEDWKMALYLEAQAELVRVEGMKAANASRLAEGLSPEYSQDHFDGSASNIDSIACSIKQG